MPTPSAPLTSSLVTISSVFSSMLSDFPRLRLEIKIGCSATLDAVDMALTVLVYVSNSNMQPYDV